MTTAKLPSLYDIADEYKEVFELIGSGDFTEDELKDTLEGVEGTFKIKAINVAKMIRHFETLAEAKKKASDNMSNSSKSYKNKGENMRNYLFAMMEKTKILKVEDAEFNIDIVNTPARLIITDVDAIPDKYKTTEEVTKVDNTMIKNDLKAIDPKTGSNEFAELRTGKKLRIK